MKPENARVQGPAKTLPTISFALVFFSLASFTGCSPQNDDWVDGTSKGPLVQHVRLLDPPSFPVDDFNQFQYSRPQQLAADQVLTGNFGTEVTSDDPAHPSNVRLFAIAPGDLLPSGIVLRFDDSADLDLYVFDQFGQLYAHSDMFGMGGEERLVLSDNSELRRPAFALVHRYLGQSSFEISAVAQAVDIVPECSLYVGDTATNRISAALQYNFHSYYSINGESIDLNLEAFTSVDLDLYVYQCSTQETCPTKSRLRQRFLDETCEEVARSSQYGTSTEKIPLITDPNSEYVFVVFNWGSLSLGGSEQAAYMLNVAASTGAP